MRRYILGFAGVIFVYGLAWFGLATFIEQKIATQFENASQNGTQIIVGDRHKSGFPFAVNVSFTPFTLITPSGIKFSSAEIALGTHLIDTSKITIHASHGLTITVPAGKTRSEIMTNIETASGTITNGSEGFQSGQLVFSRTKIQGLLENALNIDNIVIEAAKADTNPENHTDAGGHLSVKSSDLVLPAKNVAALGNRIEHIDFDATIMGKPPQLTEASLRAWRDDGGTIEVNGLSVAWGPLLLGLGGTLALDNDFQPLGSFNAKITGFSQTLDALVNADLVKRNSASLIAIGLGLMSHPEGDNNIPTITVPVTLQNRAIYLASFKLAPLPAVTLY